MLDAQRIPGIEGGRFFPEGTQWRERLPRGSDENEGGMFENLSLPAMGMQHTLQPATQRLWLAAKGKGSAEA